MTISLPQLIEEVGADNITLQPLDECTLNIARVSDHCRVTFATKTGFDMEGLERFGLVIWIDRDRADEVIDKLSSENTSDPTDQGGTNGNQPL